MGPIDPSGCHVVSVRIRAQRNLEGYRMIPACSREERMDIERKSVAALQKLASNLQMQGEYFPLRSSTSYAPKSGGMTDADVERLEQEDALFHEPDAALVLATGSGRNWPEGRGVFASKTNDGGELMTWINEEDHLRLWISQRGGDLQGAFKRFSLAEKNLLSILRETGDDFAWSSRLGYLTACPSHLGTGMRMEVCVRLPLLSVQVGFKQLCRRLRLQARVRSSSGFSLSDVWELSNTERLGTSD